MKFLPLNKTYHEPGKHRFIGVEKREVEESLGSAEGKFEVVLKRLDQSPLMLSVGDLTELSRGISSADTELQKKFNASRRAQFNQLVNHHIDRIKSGVDRSMPSQLLFAIIRNPNLARFLSSSQRRVIDQLLSAQRESIESIINKAPGEWTSSESLRLMRSFRYVWGSKVSGKVDPLYQKAVEKVLEKSQSLIDTYKANGNKLKPDSDSEPGTRSIQAKEQLFILEVYRNFPTQNFWEEHNSQEDYKVLKLAREEIRGQLFAASTLKNKPEHILFWEIIDDEFSAQENGYTPAQIAEFVRESQKVRFLAQLEKRPLSALSPAEVKLLKEIKEELVDGSSGNWEKKFENFMADSEYERLKKESKTEDSKGNFEIDKLEADLTAAKEKQKKIEEAFLAEIKGDTPLTKAFIDKVFSSGVVKEESRESLKKEWDQIQSALEQTNDDNDGSVDVTRKNAAERQLKTFALRLWEGAQGKYIDKKGESFVAVKAEVEELSTELEKANLVNRLSKESYEEKEELEGILGFYLDTANRVEQIDENHRKNLRTRILEKRLTDIDLDLIRAAAEDESDDAKATYNLDDISSDLVKKFGELYNGFKDLIKAELELTGEVISPAEIESVEAALQSEELKSIIARRKFGEKIKEFSVKFNVLPSALIDFLAYTYREKVIRELPEEVDLANQPKGEAKAFADFFESYARQHQSIYDYDRLEKLNGVDLESKSKQLNLERKAETERSKIDQIFANSDPMTIKSKILTPNILPGRDIDDAYSTVEKSLKELHSKTDLREVSVAEILDLTKESLAPFVLPEALENERFIRELVESFIARIGRREVLEAFEKRYNLWKNGDQQKYVSELDRIELGRLFSPYEYQVTIISQRLNLLIGQIKESLMSEKDTNSLVEKLFDEFQSVFAPQWTQLTNNFFDELQTYFDDKYGKGAYKDLLEQQKTGSINILKGIGVQIGAMREAALANKLTQFNTGFGILAEAIERLRGKFDFLNGEWAAEAAEDKNTNLESVAKTAQSVYEKMGLFQPEGKNEAGKKFKARNEALQKKLEAYRSSARKFLSFAQKDIDELDDESFKQAYGMSRRALMQIVAQTESGLEQFNQFSNYFNKPNFYAEWYAKYLNPATCNTALTEMEVFEKVELIVEENDLTEQTESFTELIGYYETNRLKMVGRALQKMTTGWSVKWYSVRSIIEVAKRFLESRDRRIQRRDEKMTAELGRRIFGDSDVGQEFQRMENEKFEERVNEYKKRHERRTYNYMVEIMKTTKDSDEFYAIVELMIEKGWMRFDDPEFLRALMRFQIKISGFAAINFDIPGDVELYVTQPEMIKLKIERAFMSIWDDYPAWLRWKSDINSKYKSQMDGVAADYEEEVQSGGVDRYLQEIIESWRNGEEIATFEPYRFEGYIYKSFEQAQMNGPSHRRLYYLVMGLGLKNPKTGKTLLSPQAYRRLALPLFNQVPYLDALTDSGTPKKDGKIVPPGTPGAEQRPWNYNDFQCWIDDYFSGFNSSDTQSVNMGSHRFLNEVLMNAGTYKNRMNKADYEKIDRDDYGSLWVGANYDRVEELWTKASGDRTKADIEARYNFLAEFPAYFHGAITSFKRDLANNTADPNSPEFLQWKRERLLRISNMVRVAFMSVNKMAGNYNINGAQRPAELDREYWDDPSSRANVTRRQTNLVVETIIGRPMSERARTMNAVVEYNGYDKSRDADTEQEMHAILSDNSFFDLEKIESFVMGYAAPVDAYQDLAKNMEERKDKNK